MKRSTQTLLSWVLMFAFAFTFTLDADAQKKKKKKRKKDKEEQVVVPPSRIIDSDRSEVCEVFTFTDGEPTDQDLARISQNFADMNLRRQVRDYGPGEYSAMHYWEKMYEEAPGFSILVYTDGSAIFREMASVAKEEGDTTLFQEYAERSLELLDEGEKCYPETQGKFGVAKAYIYELLHPNKYETIFDLYTEGFSDKTDPYSLISITRYALYMGYIDQISMDDAKEWLAETQAVAKKYPEKRDYEYALETIDDIWAEQYADLYQQKIDYAKQQEEAKNNPTASTSQGSGASGDATNAYSDMMSGFDSGDMVKANNNFNTYVDAIEDPKQKYDIAMFAGQTFYTKNDFAKARSAFQKAIAADSSQGDPYYFIGSMYLSSGELCGPGTGFDSQRVIWPAFDKYNLALSKANITPDFATDIRSTMQTYKQYLPTDAQLVEQGLKTGSTYTVPCWINETTTVRSNTSMSN